MPLQNKTANQYYSFNIGKVHFLFVNYDWYVNNPTNPQYQTAMIEFIHRDLIEANLTRSLRPWIITVTHRPIYCSYSHPADLPSKKCHAFYDKYRLFEEIWYEYRVDMVMQAHVHYWERMGPVAGNKSMPFYSPPGDLKYNYIINPQAPVYTLDGSAGNNYYMVSEPSISINFL